jgi:hypothetical protein
MAPGMRLASFDHVSVCPANCEARHIRLQSSALSLKLAGGNSSIEDGTNEDASDGILVVQVCRFRAISRKIPEAATRVRCG